MITPKLKPCAGCGEDKIIWKNHDGEKFCKDCWYRKSPVKFPSQSKALSPVSDKRKPLDQLYSKLRLQFLERPENATCRAKFQGCNGYSKENLTIHHTRGRGKFYLDTATWIPLCINCHRFVEENPTAAKEMLLSENRL